MTPDQAIEALRSLGVVIVRDTGARSLPVEDAASRLSFSPKWVREHLELFPNAWRAPGGGSNGGEIRIPVADLERFETSRRIQR